MSLFVSAAIWGCCALVSQSSVSTRAEEISGPWVDTTAYEYFHVVVPEDSSPEMTYAAKAFCQYWKIATGSEITASSVNDGKINVWLGTPAVLKEITLPENLEGLSPEGFLLQTYSPNARASKKGAQKQLFIAGGTDEAVTHGVYAFFQEVMNGRWLAPGVTMPPRSRFTLNTFYMRGDRAFAFREAAIHGLWKDAKAEEFRRGLYLPPKFVPPPVDSLSVPMKPAAPEISEDSMEYGSETGAKHIAERIVAWVKAGDNADAETRLRRDRAGWPPGINIWSLSSMDWLHPVLSPDGASLNEKEGTPAAAVVFTANRVAELLAEAFPQQPPRIHVLLPPELRKPPKTLRPGKHVIVQLSNADSDFSTPLEKDRTDGGFASHLHEWAKLSAELWVLDHVANRRDPALPFPNLRVIQPNILFYTQNRVTGVYAAGGETGPVDLAEMRAYLISSYLWNPDVSPDQILREYCVFYYEAAAQTVLDCITVLEGAVKKSGKPLHSDDDCVWLDDSTIAQLLEKLTASMSAPYIQPETKKRVEAFAAAIRHVAEKRAGGKPVN